MATKSAIGWTESTWNPTTGCTKISAGCKNCYAERMSHRLKRMNTKKYKNDFKFTIHKSDLETPLHWKKPRRIFVNSMSDLFHEKTDLAFVAQCFDVMNDASQHQYQILTKRPEIMKNFVANYKKILNKSINDHIWLGVSVENKETKNRIGVLRKIKTSVRFVSFEPLLESVGKINLDGISWAIIGGESGPHHRPVRPEWVDEIIEQAKHQNVKIFFKQWGGLTPKSNGRTIHGRTYDEYPKTKRDATHGC